MQKFFELVPSGTSFDFVNNRKKYLMASLFVVVMSIVMMAVNLGTKGSALNFGIDFEGGSQVRVALDKEVDINDLRDSIDEFGYVGGSVVAVPDAENQVMIRVKETVSISDETKTACKAAVAALPAAKMFDDRGFEHPKGSSKIFMRFMESPDYDAVEQAMNGAGCAGTADPVASKEGEFKVEYALVGVGMKLSEQIDGKYGAGTVVDIVASETVGAKVGDQLKVDGALAMIYAIAFIFLFVMVRFDLRFAPGGIVALTHDAIIVVGAFAVFWKEFNLQTIAALLTIVGYSINDTIVVFDRVRERVALDRDAPIEETTNRALNETLSRTVLTSGTTLLVVASIWLLGSGAIKDFAFALIVGVFVGTYSSLFVAAPIFLWVNDRFYQGRGHLAMADEEREGTGSLLGGIAGGGAPDEPAADGPASEGGGDGERKASRRRRRKRPSS
jgi:preprotein translocase subunit SecF